MPWGKCELSTYLMDGGSSWLALHNAACGRARSGPHLVVIYRTGE